MEAWHVALKAQFSTVLKRCSSMPSSELRPANWPQTIKRLALFLEKILVDPIHPASLSLRSSRRRSVKRILMLRRQQLRFLLPPSPAVNLSLRHYAFLRDDSAADLHLQIKTNEPRFLFCFSFFCAHGRAYLPLSQSDLLS